MRTQTLPRRHVFGDIWVYLTGTWPSRISAVFAGVFGYFGALVERYSIVLCVAAVMKQPPDVQNAIFSCVKASVSRNGKSN